MRTAPRIVLAANSAFDGTRAQALLDASGYGAVGPAQPARDILVRGEGWEVLVASCPKDSPELRAVLSAIRAKDEAFPIIFLADELTEGISTLANDFGAWVCLFSHGVPPLRAALDGATRHLEHKRAHDDHLQRQVEDAVRTSEHMRALVYVSVADVIFYLRIENDRFRFIEINPAFTRSTGLTESQVVGRFVDEVIPEPSLSLVLGKYREAVRERRTVRWDEVTHYPAGKRFGEVSITPVVDSDGRATHLIGTVQDVTEARQRSETIRQYANIVRSVQLGLTVWSVGDVDSEQGVKLETFNPAAEATSGVRLSNRVGQTLSVIYPGNAALAQTLREVARDGKTRELRSVRFADTPSQIFNIKLFLLSGGSVAMAADDVTEEERARELGAAERRVLELVASGASLEHCLESLVIAIEAQAPPAIASVLLLSADGKHVRHGSAPHLPKGYNDAIDGRPIGMNAGSCGTAAATGQSVIVTDVEADPRWATYRDLARRYDLRACWSTPVVAPDGRVLGTFALYYREPRSPTSSELEIIARATHVAAIAIQRHELDQQLRELSSRLEAAREEERTGIARELHDQLGQSLTALKLELAWISRHANEATGLSPEKLTAKLKDLMATTDELIGQLRRISSELRPGVLDDIGLDSALNWQAMEFQRRSGIPVQVTSELADSRLERSVATAVFRVFQEALTNIARHAGASRVEVRLLYSAGMLTLTVQDNGKGIRPEDVRAPQSLGLLGIRERARRFGGTASFARTEPHGTMLTLQIPIEQPASVPVP